MIRKTLELLSRGRVLKRKLKVGRINIPIYISPDAQLKYLKFGKGGFDSDLVKIAQKFLNTHSNVWDIGGNVGTFTFSSSEIARNGQILCVEQDVWLESVINKTKQNN